MTGKDRETMILTETLEKSPSPMLLTPATHGNPFSLTFHPMMIRFSYNFDSKNVYVSPPVKTHSHTQDKAIKNVVGIKKNLGCC